MGSAQGSNPQIDGHAPARLDGFVRELVEPTLGFEPRTCCLRNSCSTAELCRPGFHAQLQLITGDSTDSG